MSVSETIDIDEKLVRGALQSVVSDPNFAGAKRLRETHVIQGRGVGVTFDAGCVNRLINFVRRDTDLDHAGRDVDHLAAHYAGCTEALILLRSLRDDAGTPLFSTLLLAQWD